MKRIEGSDVAQDLFGAGKDGFQDEDPGVVPATVVTTDWLNQVQEELLSVIEAAGLTPGTSAQLAEAITKNRWKFSHASGIAAVEGAIRARSGVAYPTEFGYCDALGAAYEPSRVLRIPLSAGVAQDVGDQWDFVCAASGSYYRVASTTYGGARKLVWEVPLPKSARVTAVHAAVERVSGSGSITLNVFQAVPSSPGVGSAAVTLLGTASVSSGTPTQLDVTGSPLYTQDAVRRLVVSVTVPTGGGADKIHEVWLEFDDPGPRNY